MTRSPITVAAVGAGFRTRGYCQYALEHPDKMKVVAIAEPDAARRSAMAQEHAVPPERCFASADELAAQPQLADAVINGTMDRQHYATGMPLIRRGYHMLLEKPIATTEAEVRDLITAASEHQRTADEDDRHSGNVVLTSVLAAKLHHKVVRTRLDHYSLTRYIAQMLGVTPLRSGRTAPNMKAAFGL